MPQPLIQVRNLEFAYDRGSPAGGEGRFQLRIPALDVASGEKTAVIGRSGCGKTTLARLIAGIQQPGSGSVIFDGLTLTDKSDAERRNFRISNIGFIFQEFELLDYLRAEENILLPYLVNGSMRLGSTARERARALAGSLGLGGKLMRRPGELSQGERQRLAICRALVTEPKLIIADEPTGNLDPRTAAGVMELIQNQVEKAGATLLMITHDHGLLDDFDQVVDMENSQSLGGGVAGSS